MRYFSFLGCLLYCSITLSQSKLAKDDRDAKASIPVQMQPKGRTTVCPEEKELIVCGPIQNDAQVKDLKHWQNYLARNPILNSLAQDTVPEGVYKVIALFIIDKKGCITNVRVQNDPGYGLGDKIIKVISRYPGKWYPAIRNGRNVKAYKQQEMTIVVERNKCELQEEVKEFIL